MDCVLLNSGGKDTLATILLLRKPEVVLHSVFVDFGQQNRVRAMPQAEKFASMFCKSHTVVTISNEWFIEIDAPNPTLSHTFVPFQNIMVTMAGVMHAVKIGAKYVVSGYNYAGGKEFMMKVRELMTLSPMPPEIRPIISFPLTDLGADDPIYSAVEQMPAVKDAVACNAHPPCGTCAKCEWRASRGFSPN